MNQERGIALFLCSGCKEVFGVLVGNLREGIHIQCQPSNFQDGRDYRTCKKSWSGKYLSDLKSKSQKEITEIPIPGTEKYAHRKEEFEEYLPF